MREDMSTLSGWDAPLAERYRLDGLLGRGSMADVHQAEDTRLRRGVAIKLFRPDPEPRAQQRFGEEARVLAQLSHPGLVAIYDAGIDSAQPYLVMQLVQGESLRSRLLSGPLTPAEVIQLGTNLAAAINHVHQHGIVHRDIKPANILLDTEGDPHVADFGIALLIGAAELTNATEIVGTIAYLAPEQILGTQITPAADIYALGLVLLESLTGKPVYPEASNIKSTLTRLHRPPHIPPTVPAHLAALLATMTDTDAHQRPTAEQCADTLRKLNSRPPPTQPPPDRPQAPVRQRHRPYLAAAGVVAATVAALALTLSPRAPAQGQFPNSAGSDQATSHTVPSQPPAALAPSVPASPVPHTTRDTAAPVTTVAEAPVAPAASTDLIPDRSSNNHPTTATSQTSETTTNTATATASDPPTT
jgi:eukaryotic-like serine/threonine-protein kinase